MYETPADPELIRRYTEAVDRLIRTSREWRCSITRQPATPEEIRQLRSLGVREPILSLMKAAVLSDTADFAMRIQDVAGMVCENTELGPGEDVCPMGFVIVGSSLCGDGIALDFYSPPSKDGTPRVVLVSHERSWTDAAQVAAYARELAPSFVEFLNRAANLEYRI